MNFVYHISKGFRGLGGGYSSSITHTMAHELGHGIFGLDHIFSGAYGIKKGVTYNLMDYTEKTPNDALSYHEWTQINLPLPSWSALSRVEEDMWVEETQASEIIRFISSFRCAKKRGDATFSFFHSRDGYDANKVINTPMKDVLRFFNSIASKSIEETYIKLEFRDISIPDQNSRRMYTGYVSNLIKTYGYEIQHIRNGKFIIRFDSDGDYQPVLSVIGNQESLDILKDYMGIDLNPTIMPQIGQLYAALERDEILYLLRYSLCELETLGKDTRITILRKILSKVENAWLDRDSYWELARNLILSAPDDQFNSIKQYIENEGKILKIALCEHTDPLYVKALLERSQYKNGILVSMEEAATLAAHSYGDKGDEIIADYGWRRVIPENSELLKDLEKNGFIIEDNNSGFKSQLYEKIINGEKVYCYSTAGTDVNIKIKPSEVNPYVPYPYAYPYSDPGLSPDLDVDVDWDDIYEDVFQGIFGILGPQYEIASNNAIILSKTLANAKLIFVGHSLGGALATMNALMTGRDAYTFNAAGIKRETLSMLLPLTNPKVINYVIRGEFVNWANKKTNCWYGGSEPIYIDKNGDCEESHSIDCFFK